MSEREVDVEVSFSVITEGYTPFEARSEVAQRVKEAIDGIEGKTDGIAVGTSGGEKVDDE